MPAGLQGPAREEYIRTQLLTREARRLGLDQNDSIIERQLQQKMRALLEAGDGLPEPTTEQLQAWLDAHPGRYAGEERLSLQLYSFARSQYGAEPDAARSALQQLRRGENPGPSLETLQDQRPSQLRKRFGREFVEGLADLGPDWQEPLRSGLGWHLVKITARQPPAPATVDKLADRLRRDWQQAQRETRYREGLRRLRGRYQIQVGQP